jgi:fibronectin-binding autotransporter adhesin
MKRNRIVVVLLACLSCASAARAQFTANNQTNIISGVTSNWVGNGTYVVGSNTFLDALLINSGGILSNGIGYIGYEVGASNNTAIVSGSGSVWSNWLDLYVGDSGAGNQLIVTNGGSAINGHGVLGLNSSSSSNVATIAGSGSVWSNQYDVDVGYYGTGNSLLISNQGKVVTGRGGYLGVYFSSNNNVVVADGAIWDMAYGLRVGLGGSSNMLTIVGGSVLCSNAIIGYSDPSFGIASNNVIRVDSGSLFVINAAGTGSLVVSRADGKGELILNGGSVTVGNLIATNGISSVVTLNGGTLGSAATFVTNTQQFVVGNGSSAATFHLLGGVHSFNNGLRVRNNAAMTGCGTINGIVVLDAGGTVLADCGSSLTFNGSVTNYGTLRAINGSILEAYGTVVNNGTIDAINGFTNFHGAFINNGTVLDASNVKISQASKSGQDLIVQVSSVTGHTYQLQFSPSMMPTNWASTGSPQSGTGGVLTFTDPGGATNFPARFYRVDVTAP